MLGVKGDLAKIALTAPACAQVKDKVALSRRIDKHWRLVGRSLRVCAESASLVQPADPTTNLQAGERSYGVRLPR